MAVGYQGLPKLYPVAGLRLGTTSAGIKKPDRRDLVVMELAEGSSTAAVFTRNAFCAAPVVVAREHLAAISPRLFLVNTGNANAGTGRRGMDDAYHCCGAAAKVVGLQMQQVLPFSTGVIGEPLPVEKIVAALPAAVDALDENGWEEAASGILTTDTVPKGASRCFDVDGKTITVTGISKGSGMIRPDMATMLAFIATDAQVDGQLLQQMLNKAVSYSFNRITVDGDTSTNDACMLVATGASGVSVAEGTELYQQLLEQITEVAIELAQLIVRDGEGATKFIAIEVTGAKSGDEARAVAYTIAHSPLVKTALFASDPNWGRILAAVGRSGIEGLDLDAVVIHLDDVCIVRDGGRADDYTEERGQQVMAQEEITIRVELARGEVTTTLWTCDLSYDYVRINAEYRT